MVKNNFDFKDTKLNGIIRIIPFQSYDNRGSLIKDYNKEVYLKYAINFGIEEIFYTSSKKGVIRAIHFQRSKPQSKLIRCISGAIFDVVVDLRKNSETFGQWEGFYLSADNNEQLLIPAGFGHGYLVLEDSIVSYKCDEVFYDEFDDGIIWNDQSLNIKWPLIEVKNELILSEKDKNLQTFEEFKRNYQTL